ncbi:MAG: membrane protein insertion efficiency factor YidD [Defluviitaleaceae bacterium]|nr:membrane protein insertion efficiency factor YidD [Defluviitaleaceae bacterium]
MAKVLLFLVFLYQKSISPYLAPRCRYSPTCSHYAYESIKTHGALLGVVLAVFRLLRCNPLSKGGYDPVPPKKFYNLGLW